MKWGCHCCQFYRTAEDMLDVLVPFFAAGLEANELCLWVTSTPLDVPTARRALAQVVPDLDQRVKRGQLEFFDGDAWYQTRQFDADATLQQWAHRERRARESGFEGLRLTGNTLWVHGPHWHAFADYERRVNELFRDLRVLAVCTYHVESCSAGEVLDVVRNHEFAIARRDGEWEMIESASVKVAKAALREANAELEERVHERTQALATAVSKRDEFLAMLAHELRNPLAPIRNATQIVRLRATQTGDASLESAGAMLDRQVTQMTRLVDELLDVARVTQGKISLHLQPLDLLAVIQQALESVRHHLLDRRHRVVTDLPLEPVPFVGDQQRLVQVIANLLDNAAKFTPAGGRVSIELKEESDWLLVSVTDSGVGIAAEQLATVFEPFTQARQSLDRPNGGLGLGLTVVQRVVQMHGGHVTAHSEGKDLGTRIEVKLRKSALVPVAANGARGSSGPQFAKRMLIVDDNIDAAQSLAVLLKMHGHRVTVVHDGETALREAASNPFDAVLLDLGLPGIDRYEVARRITSREGGVTPEVIALSGYGDSAAKALAKSAGCAAHLSKPADLSEVLQAIADAPAQLH